MPNPISHNDLSAITHINYVTNQMHTLTTDLYEDLMERDHETAKDKAKAIVIMMNDLIKSLSDEI
jgi:hypothetical protein